MKNKYNILIVEDEIIASHYLKEILHSLGHKDVFQVTNAKDAIDKIIEHHIDLVFLDINISGSMDGIVCANKLNEKYFVPVIFSTAYCDTHTMEEASKTNMFGYLMKPFEKQDVEASLFVALNRLSKTEKHKVVHRVPKSKESIQINSKLSFSLHTRTLFRYTIPIDLTKKEMLILYVLSTNLNQNISFKTIQEKVWDSKDVSGATIRDTIRRLRAKAPELDIQSVAGFGYILKVDV